MAKHHYGADKLDKALRDWTISSVEPNTTALEGGQFILNLTKDGKKRRVRVCGNDLGWWFTQDKDKGKK